MSTAMRWTCLALVLAAACSAGAADVVFLQGRTVDGTLNPQARLQVVHAAMQRECGAAPGSNRCRRLKREFQQEARNCHKHAK